MYEHEKPVIFSSLTVEQVKQTLECTNLRLYILDSASLLQC